jgi:hypothetical protein
MITTKTSNKPMHYLWVDRIAMAYLAQIEPPGCFFRQHPENCVNEVRQKDRTFYIRLKNTQL